MTIHAALPGHISGDEKLGRSVTGLYEAKTPSGRALRDAFVDNRAVSLSVDRLDFAPRSEMARIARERERRRDPPRSFAGWAIVGARRAETRGRSVEATPQEDNPYHADIHLPICKSDPAKLIRDTRKAHALELAAHSHWEPAPKQQGARQ